MMRHNVQNKLTNIQRFSNNDNVHCVCVITGKLKKVKVTIFTRCVNYWNTWNGIVYSYLKYESTDK